MKKYLFFFFSTIIISAHTQTVGLIRHNTGGLYNGYLLFAPMTNDTTYLIDMCDEKVHQWYSSYTPGLSVYLLPDGTLLRTDHTNNAYFTAGGSGGEIEELDWNSHVKWKYMISDSTQCQHHDIRILPNGDILAIVWEKKTLSEAINAGRDTLYLSNNSTGFWCEKIVELQPVDSIHANIVWEWHLWDHLVQDFDSTKANYGDVSNPRLLNINYRGGTIADWFHMDAIDYNPTLDQIVISSRSLDEFYIIDHSTTTAEAASHSGGKYGKGGDFLYRWGNAQAYISSAPASTHCIFGQHDVHWIPAGMPNAGNILIFNNGAKRPGGNYSSADMVTLPDSAGTGVYYAPSPYYGPDSATVVYKDSVPADFYSANLGSVQQLINGSVLVCGGAIGDFLETDSTQSKVWEYINPVSTTGIMTQGSTPAGNPVFRCIFYPDTSSALAGHTLTPIAPIEHNPITYSCSSANGVITLPGNTLFTFFPNPANKMVTIKTSLSDFSVMITNTLGQVIYTGKNTKTIDTQNIPEGMYFITIETRDSKSIGKLLIAR